MNTRFRPFKTTDFKDAPAGWFPLFLSQLNDFLGSVAAALTARLSRADNLQAKDLEFDFTTLATAANTFPLRFANPLPVNAAKVTIHVGRFARADGAAPANAWSIAFTPNSQGEFEVTFQGLENSTRYVGILCFSA